MWVGRDCSVTTLRWGVDSSWRSSLSSLCTEAACSSSITCRGTRQGCGCFEPTGSHCGKPCSRGLRPKGPPSNYYST